MNHAPPQFAAVSDGKKKWPLADSISSVRRHYRWTLVICLICLANLLASPLVAHGEEPWDLIPANASAVIRLQAPETTIQELAEFADEIQPGFGAMIQGRASLLGPVISNPTLAGVDMSRDWYVAVFAVSGTQTEEVMLIPSTDVSAMQDAVGSDFEFLERDSWVAYSDKTELIEQVKECAAGKRPDISTLFDKRSTKELNSGQLGIFINVHSLQETFADELAGADAQLDEFIEMIASQFPAGSNGLDMTSIWNMYGDMGRVAIQAARDSSSLVLNISIRDRTLRIEKLLTMTEGSTTGQFLSAQPVSDMELLKSLPDGLTGYVSMHGDPEPFHEWAEKALDGLFQDSETTQRFQKALALVRETGPGTFAGGGELVLDEDNGALRYFGVSRFSPASKVREAMHVLGDEMEYEIGGIYQRITIKTDAETIDGESVDVINIEQEFPAELDQLGIQLAFNERLYGPGGMTQRLVFREDLLLQTLGGGQESMQRLLNTETWKNSKLLAARQRLPEQANVIIVGDVPSYFRDVANMILSSGALPIPIQVPGLEDLEIPPSYAGIAIAAESNRLHVRTVIPQETFQGITKLGLFFQQTLQGGF